MAQPDNNETASPDQEVSIGRRQLLKVLATSGMAAAATQLPAHWVAPVAEGSKLPAQAQVSIAAPVYSGVCDSQPGGGDLLVTNGLISNIRPYLQVMSGVGTLQDITTTMSLSAGAPSTLTFSPPLPQTATTDASGRANFGNLLVTWNPNDSFSLVFDFATPSGNVHVQCGVFFFGQG